MVDIASELQWKYVNTIAEAGTYGEKGIEAFKEAAKKSGELSWGWTGDRGLFFLWSTCWTVHRGGGHGPVVDESNWPWAIVDESNGPWAIVDESNGPLLMRSTGHGPLFKRPTGHGPLLMRPTGHGLLLMSPTGHGHC